MTSVFSRRSGTAHYPMTVREREPWASRAGPDQPRNQSRRPGRSRSRPGACARRTATGWLSIPSTSRSRPGRCSVSSGRTAPARQPSSGSSRRSSGLTGVTSRSPGSPTPGRWTSAVASACFPRAPGIPPAQTAEEWLTYHARLFGAGRRAAGATPVACCPRSGSEKRAGVQDLFGLSRGLRQRLGIARAIVNNPELVFLDEPTLGLDPAGQRQVLELVARIARDQGVTVMLSTHTLAEVEQVCNRVVILNHGRIVADGTVREIMRRAAAPRRGIVQVPAGLRPRATRALDHGRSSVGGARPSGRGRAHAPGGPARRGVGQPLRCAACSMRVCRSSASRWRAAGSATPSSRSRKGRPMTELTLDPTGSAPAWSWWRIVSCVDLWLSGRGLVLMLAQTTLLSVTTYLVATNQELNFLEQREAVSLTLQVAVAVGGLLVVLSSADALSGERERGSLETPPAHARAPPCALSSARGSRRSRCGWAPTSSPCRTCGGWDGTSAPSAPHWWGGLLVGSLLAFALTGLGLLISSVLHLQRRECLAQLLLLFALYAPTQMPTASQRGWAGELLVRADPFTSGLLYLERLIVNSHRFGQNAGLLLSPVVAAVATRCGRADAAASRPAAQGAAVNRRLVPLVLVVSALASRPRPPSCGAPARLRSPTSPLGGALDKTERPGGYRAADQFASTVRNTGGAGRSPASSLTSPSRPATPTSTSTRRTGLPRRTQYVDRLAPGRRDDPRLERPGRDR